MNIEYHVMEQNRNGARSVYVALCEQEALKWIAQQMPPDLMGTVEYFINRVYTNRKPNPNLQS